MFDAKSLIEMMMRGAGQPQGGPGGGGLGDILGQLGQVLGQAGAQGGGQGGGQPRGGGGMSGLEDLLRGLGGGGGQAGGEAPRGGSGVPGLEDLMRGGGQRPDALERHAVPEGQGGLGDILGRLQEQLGQAQGGAGAGAGAGSGAGGGLLDILGQVLGQATGGVREGAQRVDDATGASGRMRDAVGNATGQSPDDLLAKLKELIANNQAGAGAAAGGLGAILLGTKTGRSIAMNAVKLGGLALIGGLAYKALQNWQQGRPAAANPQQLGLTAAPAGSGYEAGAISNESAILYIRGMIAAAAADGRIDAQEQQKILGGLQQAGLGQAAEEFLAGELNNPATADDLVAAVTTQEEAVQLFTAARISVDLDTQEEHDFLVGLARGLGLDANLVAHVDAAARAA